LVLPSSSGAASSGRDVGWWIITALIAAGVLGMLAAAWCVFSISAGAARGQGGEDDE
jgi:hypothetical protein